jgi:hypothetical protein
MTDMKSVLSGGKSAAKSTTKTPSSKKVRVVDLGPKRSFKITKPGALKKKAETAGESTKQFAKSHDKGNSDTARQSRAALGLMGMDK